MTRVRRSSKNKRLLRVAVLGSATVLGICVPQASADQSFGLDGFHAPFPSPAAPHPDDVRKQLEVLDPELAEAIHWPQRDVPALVPLTAADYIADRERILAADAARKATLWTKLRAALESGYNLTFSVHGRLERESSR